MTDLHLDAFGHGTPALFVHGSFGWGLDNFPHQQALADGYRVILVDRRGFGASPRGDHLGWPTDMHDVAALLGELGGAHLVGQSAGAVVSLLTAGLRPELVRSLVVIEPPLFDLVADDADVARIIAALRPVVRRAAELTAAEFAAEWAAALGRDAAGIAAWTASFTDRDWAAAEASRHEAWPGDAPVDFEALAGASFPKVVVAGGWPETAAPGRAATGRAYRAVGTAIARRIGAEFVVLADSSHNPQVEDHEAFNALLSSVWAQADEAGG
jgi:pimeloyl-ACP methyl ester carboxylesterase